MLARLSTLQAPSTYRRKGIRMIRIKGTIFVVFWLAAIFLATGEAIDRQGNKSPSGNVIHEIGLAQTTPKLKNKIIYLLERKTEFPSNIKPKAYIRFSRRRIESVYKQIVKETKAMGF